MVPITASDVHLVGVVVGEDTDFGRGGDFFIAEDGSSYVMGYASSKEGAIEDYVKMFVETFNRMDALGDDISPGASQDFQVLRELVGRGEG